MEHMHLYLMPRNISSDPVPVFAAGFAKLIGHLILLMSVTGVCPEAVNYYHPLIIFS